MLFLIPSGRFAPKRRPQTARDELPLRPLIDVLAFWALLSLAGLFTTVDVMELYAHFAVGIVIDTSTKVLMALMAGAAPICLLFALRFWNRVRS